MAEEGIPPWVTHLTGLITDFRKETNARLDNLVTRDSFRAEQSRVNDKFDDQARDIAALTTALQAEATARTAAELAAEKKRADEAQERQKVSRATNWQWFLIVAGPVVTYLVGWILGGGLIR